MENSLKKKKLSIDVYKSLIEKNPIATFMMSDDMEVLLFNKAAVELTGYSENEMTHMAMNQIIPLECYQEFAECFYKVLLGENQCFESECITKNGHKKNISIMLYPITSTEGIGRVAGVFSDITEKTLFNKVMLHRNKILEMLTKRIEEREVLNEICYFFEAVSHKKCAIMVREPIENKLILAATSLPKTFASCIKELSIDRRESVCGKAAYQKKITNFDDMSKEPFLQPFKEEMVQLGLKSCLAIPLLNENEHILGTFSVYFHENEKMDEKGMDLFKEAAYITSLVIQHYHSKEQMEHLIYHDALTGLANRRKFSDYSAQLFERSTNTKQTFGALFIDFDRFKYINDTFGHEAGDQFLIEVAKRLVACLPSSAFVSRYGGDEFVVLLENTTTQQITNAAQEILKQTARSFEVTGNQIFVTASIGICLYPDHVTSLHMLLSKADEVMYQAKKSGGNTYRFYDKPKTK